MNIAVSGGRSIEWMRKGLLSRNDADNERFKLSSTMPASLSTTSSTRAATFASKGGDLQQWA